MASTTVVTFKKDVTPYMKGDVVALTDAQLEEVDARVKKYKIEGAYTKGKAAEDKPEDKGDGKK